MTRKFDYKSKYGMIPFMENDAQAISAHVARVSNRRDMEYKSYPYKTDDPYHPMEDYPIDPTRFIKWNKNKKY